MMDRQFNNRGVAPRGGGGSLFSRRMNTLDRFSNPFDDDVADDNDFGFSNGRGRGRGGMRGGMMGGNRGMMRGGMSRNIDPAVGIDNDYMAYNDGPRMGGGFGGMNRNMGGGMGMNNRGMGANRGMGGGMSRGMGMGSGMDRGRGMMRGGGIKNRLGAKPDTETVINPAFDSLYEPGFEKKQFDSARSKLNRQRQFSSTPATPGSYKGPSMRPPRGTWSS